MKTKEFMKAVEELGYETEMDDEWITIIYKNKTFAHIFTKELYRMSSCFSEIDCAENAGVLFALIFQYACTPIKDREEEKKYYLRHKWIKMIENNFKPFLNYREEEDKFCLFTKGQTHLVKTEFTEKEIEELKEKLNTNLDGFEMVEVEDEKV